jgi:hypothetical protein
MLRDFTLNVLHLCFIELPIGLPGIFGLIHTHMHTHMQTCSFRELAASRQKHEAISARCKTLEVDYRTMRAKMGAVLDKSDADDRLIDALKTELEVCYACGRRGSARMRLIVIYT